MFTAVDETFKVSLNKDDNNSSSKSNNKNNSSLVYLCDDSTAYHSTL
jgi:hypothetical protein